MNYNCQYFYWQLFYYKREYYNVKIRKVVITISKLIQKVKWNLDGLNTEMYMYGEADFEANKAMQEPLGKLYQYENQPNMREKVVEYIGELGTEIDRLESDLEKQMTYNVEACKVSATESRLNAIIEVKNDLLGRLEEVVQMEKKKIKAHYYNKRVERNCKEDQVM